MVSEYEAKRLRRIEENRRQLQALNLPTFGSPQSASPQKEKKEKKRKREVEESPPEPTRKSKRQKLLTKQERKQRRKEEKKQLKKKKKKQLKTQEKKEEKRLEREKRLQKVLLKKLKEEKKLQKAKEHVEYMRRKYHEKREKKRKEEEEEQRAAEERRLKWTQEPRMKDWRLRRKLQAKEEKEYVTAKKRVKQREERIKQTLKLQIKKRREFVQTASVRRRIRKRKIEERRQAKLELKELRRIERQMMRAEDLRSRKRERLEAEALEKKEKNEKKMKKMLELNRDKYPVRRVKNLPYIFITGAMMKSKEKPAMLTHELYVDVDAFHAFALGKQFLPASKNSVMQALCPSGHTAAFNDRVDLHVWSNAMTLFVPAEAAKDLDQLLREEWLDGERCVFFRWFRTKDVTDEMMERLFEIEKGDERLRIDDNYYDPPTPIGTPQPLMLFVQFPQGPFIYCGRLGYLGHKSSGLFFFQLLDINSTCMYWAQLRNMLTYWERKPDHNLDLGIFGYPFV